MQEEPDPELADLRRQIDEVNRALRDALQERARLVLAIAARKRALGLPAIDLDRERQMLDDLMAEPRAGFAPADLRDVLAGLMQRYRQLCVDARG